MAIDLRPASSRFHTRISWLDSWHSFSFGEHYDPNNVHHGLLLVLNDDVVVAGGGFGTHPHRDMEIVTWVLDGALTHRDSAGNEGTITRDVAQRMSAGSGIRHSEMNASDREAVHLLQMWVPPDTNGLAPGYEQRDISGDIKPDAMFPLASAREARRGNHDQPTRRDTVDRARFARNDSHDSPMRPSCTCSSLRARPTSKVRARSAPATPRVSPTRAQSGSPPAPSTPSS